MILLVLNVQYTFRQLDLLTAHISQAYLLLLKDIEIIIDNSLERFNELFAVAGHPNCVFKINYDDIQKITNGKVEDIIE